MTTQSERYQQRKKKRKLFRETAHINEVASQEIVHELLQQKPDDQFLQDTFISSPTYDLEVTSQEVSESLSLLDQSFTNDKYDVLFESSKEVLIDQLLAPLKLSRSDLVNVDRSFEYNRADYTKSPKSVGGDGVSFDTQKNRSKLEATTADGRIKDVNTGIYHDAGVMDFDHNKSLKSVHDDGGFMLSDAKKAEFGADSDNHSFTHQSINRSKGDKDHKEFVENSNNQDLDKRRTNAVHAQGEKAAEKYVPSDPVDKTIWIAKEGAKDGLKTGSHQGLQQAMGAMLSSFISSTFEEVKDILSNGWKNGQYNDSWLSVLKTRLGRVVKKVLGEWKNVVAAFSTGAISGLFSAISTAVINMFVRTSKNAVRLIREGFMSLMKAIKTLVFPPEGMTIKQAAHEASKVFATGLVVTGGILATETIATFINGIPFSNTISMVIGGLLSGLGSLFVVYLLDKLDLFGVNADERHEFILGTLEPRINSSIESSEAIITRLGLEY
ncbi:hypothetical protein [Vibrio gallaecicus]|uniref:Lactate permease n=2 Tax=Vibrio gallaecicus TaxID=552386 RepID=A0ABV4NGH9_9VIBR